MNTRQHRVRWHRCACWTVVFFLATAVGQHSALAQPTLEPPQLLPVPTSAPAPVRIGELTPVDGNVMQAGCSSCGAGGGLLGPVPLDGVDGGGCCCGGGPCPGPGRRPCCPCEANTFIGRFFCCLYQCMCCPDPCYQPHWVPEADAAFFVEAARPQTQQRWRYDSGSSVVFPDRSEFFWARADGKGKGPPPPTAQTPPVFLLAERRVNYDDLSMYTEVASNKLSFFVEIPYRAIQPDFVPYAAGFADMNLGTKSLLFDCELLQFTFQFKTYLPIGNTRKGLGNGHVTLEPSWLLDLKLGPNSYFEGQLAEWIPLGGDMSYAGAILHYHTSINHVLYRVLPNVPVIGTLEFSGWSFQHGAYTDPVVGSYVKSSGDTYLSIGPGVRMVVCDWLDFGMGSEFSLRRVHFADPLLRFEFRYRF